MKTNIDKQEMVVSVIWQIAHAAQQEPQPEWYRTISGTRMDPKAVHYALEHIMDIFGYDVIEVQ